MFDPAKFVVQKAKPLPVCLLLDVSGSMGGDKIQNLNNAVKDMLDTFRDTENSETEIHVAIITFGGELTLHQPLTSAGLVKWQNLSASGGTPLGEALKMAKAMIEDKNIVPSRAYRPAVILVSDGQPDPGSDWQNPLDGFIKDGRTAKCDRMAMAIGKDADESVLGKFIEGTKNPLFYAANAKQMREFFKLVAMSVTTRTQSKDPNVIPASIELKESGSGIKLSMSVTARSHSQNPNIIPASVESPQGASSTKPSDDEQGYW
jgi:uncharacterized protein YegL